MIICPNGLPNGGINGGVVEYCPTDTSVAAFFTEIIVNGNLVIPPHKPPKERIVKVTHDVRLNDVEVITVTLPDGTIPGNKIVVSGVITLNIQYAADVPTQKVHFVHYDLPFNALILTDCGEPIPLADFPDDFVVHVCVEKLRLTQIDSRTLSKEIVLMIWVEEI
ncbi:DUF3794 domain-containing protein [Phosphitispora sp. TUW77]|uniref:DUF3794 domain-containing protein n=1 Tax=Phosphitispora sp. TUW77 TaxID=3152361 RepID=UPI003AB3E70C